MSAQKQQGFTILELLVAFALSALLLTAVTGLVSRVQAVRSEAQLRVDAVRDTRFAMQRMLDAVIATDRLLLPLADNPATNWRENVREQTEPPSVPEGSSILASAVLAVTLDPQLDLDEDGFADADNDKDGAVDEDFNDDHTEDSKAGIIGIDDDGDGEVDEGSHEDDDEDGGNNEDFFDGLDNDGDGTTDEDANQDNNEDGEPGIAWVDDDLDGAVDEGNKNDDDEDDVNNEDWMDAHVFYMKNGQLIERLPNGNPLDGTDFSEYVLADDVTLFRVERIPAIGKRDTLIDITLEIDRVDTDPVRLQTRVRARTPR